MIWLWIIFAVWAAVAVIIFALSVWHDRGVYRAPGFGENLFVALLWPLWLPMAILDL